MVKIVPGMEPTKTSEDYSKKKIKSLFKKSKKNFKNKLNAKKRIKRKIIKKINQSKDARSAIE